MAVWRFYSSQRECDGGGEEPMVEESIEVTRLKVPGAPVFSLAKIPDVLPDGSTVKKRRKPQGIYLGTAAKEVLTWMLGSKDVTDKVVLGGHTGWVRSLAVTGKWMFSCGCNWLRLWDTTFSTPKEQQAVRLFTGDILAIAATNGRVFTAGADGSLRSWSMTRAGGLAEGPAAERAHGGRVAACVAHRSCVVTASYDGSIKVWDAGTLTLLAEARGAHAGEKVFCAAVGANGVLFTGGDDKLVRAWDLRLNPIGAPLEGHAAAVRVLAAGRRGALISGDADGDVCIWETYPVELPPPPAVEPSPAAAADDVLLSDVVGSAGVAAAPVEESTAAAFGDGGGIAEVVPQQLESLADSVPAAVAAAELAAAPSPPPEPQPDEWVPAVAVAHAPGCEGVEAAAAATFAEAAGLPPDAAEAAAPAPAEEPLLTGAASPPPPMAAEAEPLPQPGASVMGAEATAAVADAAAGPLLAEASEGSVVDLQPLAEAMPEAVSAALADAEAAEAPTEAATVAFGPVEVATVNGVYAHVNGHINGNAAAAEDVAVAVADANGCGSEAVMVNGHASGHVNGLVYGEVNGHGASDVNRHATADPDGHALYVNGHAHDAAVAAGDGAEGAAAAVVAHGEGREAPGAAAAAAAGAASSSPAPRVLAGLREVEVESVAAAVAAAVLAKEVVARNATAVSHARQGA